MQAERTQEGDGELLERIEKYREEYREKRQAALIAERERRHAAGEAYVAGLWLPRAQAERVQRSIARRQVWIDVELFIGVVLLAAVAWGMWIVFRILFMP